MIHVKHEMKDIWWGIRPWTRHSLVLMIAGLCYVGIGISLRVHSGGTLRRRALAVAIEWMPLTAWGWVFIFAGALAIISSRWPRFSKTWGYTVLSGLSAAWGAFYLTGVIFHRSPVSNISGAITWGLVAFLWWATSGLVDPEQVIADGYG